MTPHGGRRPGAGRPPEASAGRYKWQYRATEAEEARRRSIGLSPTDLIRAALAVYFQQEDGR